MKHVIVIMQKELAHFWGDKRLVFTTVIMPGLLIYLMYSLLGEGMMKNITTEKGYVANAYVVNLPQEIRPVLEELPVDWQVWDASAPDRERVRQEIETGERDGVLVFPENFMQEVAAYEVGQGQAPNVEIYYNSGESNSNTFYSTVRGFLSKYEEGLANKFDVNTGEGSLGEYDLVSEVGMMGRLLAGLLPMLIMTFIYSGCSAVAPESIAGEKERGTIATLLVTPMKRSALALGKVVSLSLIALMAGVSSFLGTILSLPKMMGDEVDFGVLNYTMGDYLMLFAVIVSTVLVLVAVISMISAVSRNVKEATTAMAPFMIVTMLIGLLPMMVGAMGDHPAIFLIPMFNSVMVMNRIFALEAGVGEALITIAANLAAAGILTGILTKMFGSEKIMFDK